MALIRQYSAGVCSGSGPGPDQPAGVQVSRFGVIPKSIADIVDFSALEGGSVNDGAREEICSLSYITVEDVRPERYCGWARVPVHLDDRWLLGRGACF